MMVNFARFSTSKRTRARARPHNRTQNIWCINSGQFLRNCTMAALLPDWSALAKDVIKLPDANQCKICKKNIEKPFRCPQCKLIKYCSKECAVLGWPVHKAQCGVELPKEMDQDMWEKSLRETATTKRQELCRIS